MESIRGVKIEKCIQTRRRSKSCKYSWKKRKDWKEKVIEKRGTMKKEWCTKSGREVAVLLHLIRLVVMRMCTLCTMEHVATHHLRVSVYCCTRRAHTDPRAMLGRGTVISRPLAKKRRNLLRCSVPPSAEMGNFTGIFFYLRRPG